MAQETGYDGGVGRPKTAVPLSAQYAFRTSEEVKRDFLAWLERENAGRILPVSEADALRLLVTWVSRARPALDDLNRAAPPVREPSVSPGAPGEPSGSRTPHAELTDASRSVDESESQEQPGARLLPGERVDFKRPRGRKSR